MALFEARFGIIESQTSGNTGRVLSRKVKFFQSSVKQALDWALASRRPRERGEGRWAGVKVTL